MPKTQNAIMEDVRERLDELDAYQWSDRELRKLINDAATDISRTAECLQTIVNVATVAGTQTYDQTDGIPTDFVRIHRVEWRRTGDEQDYPLQYQDWSSVDGITWGSQNISSGTPGLYTLWGSPPAVQLMLYPTPSDTGSLRIFYYRVAAQLATDGSDGGSNVDVPEGWWDVISDFAEFRALRKDKDPAWQDAKAQYQENLANLITTTIRLTDQAGQIVGDGWSGGAPAWLVGMDGY